MLGILGRPTSLLLGAATVGAVANALAVAAPLASKPDGGAMTRLGVSLQDSIAQRDQRLAQEKRSMDMREQAARAGEARLAAGMVEEQKRSGISTVQQRREAIEPRQPYDDLARIYQTMKPARAAPIFEKLDLEVQTEVARRMRERSTALLMASMSPNAAAELTMSIAGRKVIPLGSQQSGRGAPTRRQSPPGGK